MAQANPSGASLKTTLQKQIVEECGCGALVVSAEVASYYSYKLISTTNLSLPKEQWVDEFAPITTLTNTMSWAMPIASSGNKFFRVVEMGLGTYATVTLDAASPIGSTIQIMTNGTQNVPLIIYDVKSHVGSGVLGNAVIIIVANSPTSDISSLFSAVKLKMGGVTYAGQVISTGTSQLFGGSYGWKIAFSNMAIPLPADTSVPATVSVDVVANTNGILDGVQVLVGDGGINLSVQDPNYPSIIPSETGPLQGTTFTLTSQNVLVSNLSASIGAEVVSNGVVVGYPISFSFTMTAGDQSVYVSSDALTFLGVAAGPQTVLSFGGAVPVGAPSIGGLSTVPSWLAGDSGGYYMIPSGSSRGFVLNGFMSKPDSNVALRSAQILSVNYGDTPVNPTQHAINYGLQNLSVKVPF